MRTLIVGHGGRESALAFRMAQHSELHAFMGHCNPSLVRHAKASGGGHATGDVCDPRAVAAFAREREIDLAMVSADEPLAAGVVDALLAQGTRAVGPTRAGAEIEWNKAFARSLLSEVAPDAAPTLRVVTEAHEVDKAIESFGSAPVAVKPSGLTGGKGVKVMGEHLLSITGVPPRKQIAQGLLCRADVHIFDLRHGQGGEMKLGKDLIVKGDVRLFGVEQYPVTVKDDDLGSICSHSL